MYLQICIGIEHFILVSVVFIKQTNRGTNTKGHLHPKEDIQPEDKKLKDIQNSKCYVVYNLFSLMLCTMFNEGFRMCTIFVLSFLLHF